MRRISLAVAIAGAIVAAGCSGSPPASSTKGTAKGVQGKYFYVNLFSVPVGGTITSTALGINCGASTVGVVTDGNGVLQYAPTYYSGASQCGQFQAAWTSDGLPPTDTNLNAVTLTANPMGGNVFVGWAGDCSGTGTCVLGAGADKTVVAIFSKAAQAGHPNWSDPAVHAPAVTLSPLACSTCHGEQLQGMSIAPACNSCHAMPATVPAGAAAKTGLVAQIQSVTPAGTSPIQVRFTLQDGAGRNVDVTGVGFAGGSGKNHPVAVTVALMNFGKDAAGNVLPFKSSTGGNPATTTAFSNITFSNGQNQLLSGSAVPSATSFQYAAGSLTQVQADLSVKTCTVASPCTPSLTAPVVYSGTVGTQLGRACTVAKPCTCTPGNPCGPDLATVDAAGFLTFNATTGVYTYSFPTSVTYPVAAPYTTNTQTVTLAAFRKEDLTSNTGALPLTGTLTAPATLGTTQFVGSDNGKFYTAANTAFAFDLTTAAPLPKREIATDAACAKCHDGFQSKDSVAATFHSAARISAAYCNVCHYEGRGTNGFADSATFVHRIHAGKDLTKFTSGQKESPYYQITPGANYTQTLTSCGTIALGTACTCTASAPCSLAFHGIAVTYPQDARNCAECHAGAVQGGQSTSRPTIAACGSCHDTLAATFLPVAGLSLAAHPASNPAVRTNADCAGCHTAAAIAAVHVPSAPPAADNCLTLNNAAGCNANTNAGFLAAAGAVPPGAGVVTYEIGEVSTFTDGAFQRPQMTFKLKLNGADVVFNDRAVKSEIMDNFIGAPSLYFVWSQPQDGIAAPADFNASASVWLRGLWNGAVTTSTLAGPDTGGFYTVRIMNAVIPASARLLTGGIGYSYNNTSSLPLTQTNVAGFPVTDVSVTTGKINGVTCTGTVPCAAQTGGLIVPTPNAKKVATGFSGRRAVVDNAKCNACHASLGVAPTFHAGQRNDAPSCSWCHTANRTSSGWSASASAMVHGIHGAEARSVGFNWHAACQLGSTWDTVALLCKDAGGNVTEPSIFYPEVEYPGKLNDCTQCHVAGGFDFSANAAAVPNLLWLTVGTGTYAAGMSTSPLVAVGAPTLGAGYSVATATGVATEAASTTLVSSPIAGACYSCHDSATAKSHMQAKGGFIYQPRSVALAGGTATENCLGCHGKGKAWAIDAVH